MEAEIVCDQLVFGTYDGVLQEKFLAVGKLTLRRAIRLALAHELTLSREKSYRKDSYDKNDTYKKIICCENRKS